MKSWKPFVRPACLLVALAVAAAAPAYGQPGKGQKRDPAAAAGAAEKKQKARQIDEAYTASLKAIPDKPAADPWGGMRK